MRTIISLMEIREYSLRVHLGCTEEEQCSLQIVKVSFQVQFTKLPKACHSDQLKDTICYDQLCKKIRQVGESVKFQTIEKLCNELYSSLLEEIGDAALVMEVNKVQVPVEGLEEGSALFRIGQWV